MWTRVSATVPASTAAVPSKVINLQEAVQWSPGDTIVLVTTAWKGEQGWGESKGNIGRNDKGPGRGQAGGTKST